MSTNDQKTGGDLEYAALQAEADALAKREIELREALAKKAKAEEDARVSRDQIELKKQQIAEMEKKLLEPPKPYEAPKQLKTDGLDEGTAKVLRRIFLLDGGATWTHERCQWLVDHMVSIPLSQRQAAASSILDRIAAGEIDGAADFMSILKGSGGLIPNPKQLASETVDNLVKQIAMLPPGDREKAKKAVASALKKGAKKVSEITESNRLIEGPKKRKSSSDEVEVDGEVVEDDEPESPPSGGGSASPWGDFD